MVPQQRWSIIRRLALCSLSLVAGVSAALVLLLAAGGPVRTAHAATLTYPGCGGTIQDCIDGAWVGDTIVITPGSYITSFTLSQAVNLTGVNSATTILQAMAGQRVLTVTGVDVDSSIVISGLTFTGGSAAGGACPAGCGGGVLVTNGAQPRLENVILASNLANSGGGGLYVDGSIGIQGSIFENNFCTTCNGGAVNVTGALTITDTQFITNRTGSSGGAISTNGPLRVTRALFQNNSSDDGAGGGISLLDLSPQASSAVLVSTQFISNSAAQGEGGGAAMAGATPGFIVNLQDDVFQSNTANFAGGLYAAGERVLMTSTQFVQNGASGGGGGLIADWAQLNGSRFKQNYCVRSDCQGGGLYVPRLLTTSNNTQILSNTAQVSGGGAYAGQVTLSGGVVQGNSCTAAGCQGGGLFLQDVSSLSNVNVMSNSAQSSGGGVYASGAVGVTGGRWQDNNCFEAGCYGGGLFANAALAVIDSQIISNSARGSGGGLFANGPVTLTGGVVQTNQCLDPGCSGGGLRGISTLTVLGTQFLGNGSRSNGGGVYAGGAATVQGALFQANQCGQVGCSGGGIYAKNGVGLFTTRFVSNTAQANGGGLALAGGSGQVVNSLFASNYAISGNGQALYLASPGTVAILYNTIASPSAGVGAAIGIANGVVGITDTIVASTTTGISLTGGGAYQDYNLFFNVPVTVTAGVGGGAHSLTGDPAFANPALDDYHLTAGSAARDEGINVGVTSDFEGDHRPTGAGFDIGFDEFALKLFLLLVRR